MTLAHVDFLRPPLQPPLGWALLAAGAVSLGLALWCSQQWQNQRDVALREQQAVQATKDIKPVKLTPQQRVVQRRWQQAQRELRNPWLPALKAIEFATNDPIYLLALNIESDTGEVKLDAEAPNFDLALVYVQVLDLGGALRPAFMTSHAQPSPQRPDRPVVKFSVTTHWAVP